jgi:flavin-dependent dehydrogenase
MEPDPLVVGAGPTGLSAALFLFERGVRCRIVDRAAAPSATSRAQVVNPRAFELLESSGVAAAIVADGAHSVVRDSLGIQFNGSGFAETWPLYDMCLDDPLDIGNANECGQLRHAVHEKVVGRLDKLTRLARGQPEFVHFLRQRLITIVTKFPQTAHAMGELLTGLDHDVRVH